MLTEQTPWEIEADKCRKILSSSIRTDWKLPQDKFPPTDRSNVLDVPKESGLLSQKELDITDSDATGLVKMMGTGEWSAEEVTVAFLKRATIGQQLVSRPFFGILEVASTLTSLLIAEQCNRIYDR